MNLCPSLQYVYKNLKAGSCLFCSSLQNPVRFTVEYNLENLNFLRIRRSLPFSADCNP